MSFKARLEVAVHIDSFKNIDVYYQGLYALQLSLYSSQRPPGSRTLSQEA